MGIIIRQSIQNTLISYVGIVLGAVSTLLLYPYILTQDQYGLTKLFISMALICSQFANLGVKNIVIRYFPYFAEPHSARHSFFTLALIVPFIGFVLFTLLFFICEGILIDSYQDEAGLFSSYYLFLLPLVFAVLYFEVLNSYIRALKDSTTGSFLHDILVKIIIIVLLVLYHYDVLSFTQFIIYFVLNYCVQLLLLVAYLQVRKELVFRWPDHEKLTGYLKEIASYGLYSLLGGLSALLIGHIDILMLGAMTDLESTAVYVIAFYVGSVIAVPQRSINKIAMPVLAGFMKNEKLQEVHALYRRTSLNQIIAGSLLFIGIWANMHNLVDLLPPEYAGVEWVIVVVGLAKLFDMATGINGGIILNSRYYRMDLYTNLLLFVLVIATNWVLIPRYGIIGAAIATALSIIVYNTIKFIFVWMKFGIQPFRWNSLIILIIATGCLLLSFRLPYMLNFFVDITVRSLLVLSLFLGSILFFNLSGDVGQLVRNTMKRAKEYLSAES